MVGYCTARGGQNGSDPCLELVIPAENSLRDIGEVAGELMVIRCSKPLGRRLDAGGDRAARKERRGPVIAGRKRGDWRRARQPRCVSGLYVVLGVIARPAAFEIEREIVRRGASELKEPDVIVQIVDGAVLVRDGSTTPAHEEPRSAGPVVLRPISPPESYDLVLRRHLERGLQDAAVLCANWIGRRLVTGEVFPIGTRIRREAANRPLVPPLPARSKKPPLVVLDRATDIDVGVVVILQVLPAVEVLPTKIVVDIAGLYGVAHHVRAGIPMECVSTGTEDIVDGGTRELNVGCGAVRLHVHLLGVGQIGRLVVAVHLEVFDLRGDTGLPVRGKAHVALESYLSRVA